MQIKKISLPKLYEENWEKARNDIDLFASIYISPSAQQIIHPTSEQMRFLNAYLSGLYEELWMAGGNSAGKTYTAMFMGTHAANYKLRPTKGAWASFEEYQNTEYNVLCTGPEQKQSMELWEKIEAAFLNSPVLKYRVAEITTGTRRKTHPFIRLKNGATISAVGLHDKGKHIEGDAYDLILINEPPDVRYLMHCMDKVLIPRTWRRGGIIAGFGTPKGKGEYYLLWRKGQKRNEDGRKNAYYDEHVYSQYTDSRTNPHADQAKIKKYLDRKDEDLIEERIRGRFTDSSHSAFPASSIDEVIDDSMKDKILRSYHHQYIHGVDFGRKEDYTVCITWDVSTNPHTQVNFYRKGGGVGTWPEIFSDLQNIYREYGGEFFVDATAAQGDIQISWLDDLEIPYVPIRFGGTGAMKVALINNLQDYISRQAFKMPYNEQVREELYLYPKDFNDKGMETDCVFALALCAWGARNYEPLGPVTTYRR